MEEREWGGASPHDGTRLGEPDDARSGRRRLVSRGWLLLVAFLLWTSLAGLAVAALVTGSEVETARVKRLYEEAQAAWVKEQEGKGILEARPVLEKVRVILSDSTK